LGACKSEIVEDEVEVEVEFVYDVVVKQSLGLFRFQNLVFIVYDHISTICQLLSDHLRKTNTDNSV